MARILAIDYGRKRTGIAVTDPLQIIASGLETVKTAELWIFLEQYFEKEEVEKVVIGYPKQMNNELSESVKYIDPFIKKFNQKYSEKAIEKIDERFTSKMAMQAMIDGGMKKKDRQDKSMLDKISAAIILQSYLEMKNNRENLKL